MSTHRAGKSALDEFLPEAMFVVHTSEPSGRTDLYLPPSEVELDPIAIVNPSLTLPADSNTVEMWPMLAAALVAIGVSMLALAAVAKFGLGAL